MVVACILERCNLLDRGQWPLAVLHNRTHADEQRRAGGLTAQQGLLLPIPQAELVHQLGLVPRLLADS